jgi:hypothetical protein
MRGLAEVVVVNQRPQVQILSPLRVEVQAKGHFSSDGRVALDCLDRQLRHRAVDLADAAGAQLPS